MAVGGERVLTQRELDRGLLARQFLSGEAPWRAPGPEEGGRVSLHPFGSLRRADREKLEAEGERLAASMVARRPRR